MRAVVIGWGASRRWFGHLKRGNLLRMTIRHADCTLSNILEGFSSRNLNRRHIQENLQENKEKPCFQKVPADCLGMCSKYSQHQMGPPDPSSDLVNIESVFGCLLLVIDKPGATGLQELPVSCPQISLHAAVHLLRAVSHPGEEVIEQESLPIALDIQKNKPKQITNLQFSTAIQESNGCSALNLRELCPSEVPLSVSAVFFVCLFVCFFHREQTVKCNQELFGVSERLTCLLWQTTEAV